MKPFIVLSIPAVAMAAVAPGVTLTSGNVSLMVTEVSWKALAAHGIPVVPGASDVIQVNVLTASADTTALTVTVVYQSASGLVATVLTSVWTPGGTMIQFPVPGGIKGITIMSIHVVEHPDGAASDF